ncbi:hypothetical protein BJ138DRAFT_1153083 [Hygrophoropsis aurantiaca]|uniref:Uncharacterized protein n=1 Tax=Hygrophoropsis aurantiaca TaxID=72124 RepID=A0ACB8AAC5_9AGAM|nr:hypothetical protein BJ138DRAFT_1153083 [Hygrophoropsis aurantiaca]
MSTTTTTTTTTTTIQRPLRGSRVSSFYPVKTIPPLSSLESAFQLQEYISLLIRLDVHDVNSIVALPGKKGADDSDERKSEIQVDRACWVYEQLRRLAQDLSHPLITMLQQECTRVSCAEMKAGEWLYLCVAHGNDGAMEQCCAIDYILHTLDSANALLNSPRAFPSRLSIPPTSFRHFSSLARRLGRIFAHAYFHHREAFEQAEAESSLYARFLRLTAEFELVPSEFLVIPESAVVNHHHHDGRTHTEEVEPPRLLAAAIHPNLSNSQNRTASPALNASELKPKSPAGSSPAGLSPSGTDSPRKMGRSRTDTMVFSEGYHVAEELAKGGSGASPSQGSAILLDSAPPPFTASIDAESLTTDPHPPTRTVDHEALLKARSGLPSLIDPDSDEEDDAFGDSDGDAEEGMGRGEGDRRISLSPPLEELPLISLEEAGEGETALEETRPQIEAASEEELAGESAEPSAAETIVAEGTNPEMETTTSSSDFEPETPEPTTEESDPSPEPEPESSEEKPAPISDVEEDVTEAEAEAPPISTTEVEISVPANAESTDDESPVSTSISAPEDSEPEPPQEQTQNPESEVPVISVDDAETEEAQGIEQPAPEPDVDAASVPIPDDGESTATGDSIPEDEQKDIADAPEPEPQPSPEVLELSAPPPTEPIPPESESDITDEDVHDEHEVEDDV